MANELIYSGPFQTNFVRIKGKEVALPYGYFLCKHYIARKGDLYFHYRLKEWVYATRSMPFLFDYVCKKMAIQNQVTIE
jgi:hypothetical protein